ncbi:MAG: hypothetical protein HJJLKODD_01387 [Phycisphaerae bacterium]|nr:hypothetical protein [Phycisphaerae bacterium]
MYVPRYPRWSNAAFTLVELLVVVAIIALLISILLPTLNNAREQGRSVVCASNLRSLMTVALLYAENDPFEQIPSAGLMHGGVDQPLKSWVVQLAELYGKGTGIARCPSDHSPYWNTPWSFVDGDPNQPVYRKTSYASNSFTVYSYPPPPEPIECQLQLDKFGNRGPYNTLAMIYRPFATVYMVEIAEGDPSNPDTDFPTADHVHPESWFADPELAPRRELQLERHIKRANYAYFDTHVDRLEFRQTYWLDEAQSTIGPPPYIVWRHNQYDPEVGF